MMAPKAAEIPGAIPQAAKTWETPLNDQFTPWVPAEAIPTPITPPMIEWVVDTGMVKRVAIVRYVADPTIAQVMASMRTEGSDSKSLVEMTLVRMVSVTRDPTSIAPANSMTEAMHMACLRVSEREATEVAKELATSFAPVPRQFRYVD
jgi:hypothetical protein